MDINGKKQEDSIEKLNEEEIEQVSGGGKTLNKVAASGLASLSFLTSMGNVSATENTKSDTNSGNQTKSMLNSAKNKAGEFLGKIKSMSNAAKAGIVAGGSALIIGGGIAINKAQMKKFKNAFEKAYEMWKDTRTPENKSKSENSIADFFNKHCLDQDKNIKKDPDEKKMFEIFIKNKNIDKNALDAFIKSCEKIHREKMELKQKQEAERKAKEEAKKRAEEARIEKEKQEKIKSAEVILKGWKQHKAEEDAKKELEKLRQEKENEEKSMIENCIEADFSGRLILDLSKLPEDKTEIVFRSNGKVINIIGKIPKYSQLQKVDLSGCIVECIGEGAFKNEEKDWHTTSLREFKAKEIRHVKKDAFFCCVHLWRIEGLEAATSIDENAFFDCCALEGLDLPKCEYIGKQAFSYCKEIRLKNSRSLESVTKIEDFAFLECIELGDLNLPKCKYVGFGAFSRCRIKVVNGLTADAKLFNDSFDFEDVKIPNFAGKTIGGKPEDDGFRSLANSLYYKKSYKSDIEVKKDTNTRKVDEIVVKKANFVPNEHTNRLKIVFDDEGKLDEEKTIQSIGKYVYIGEDDEEVNFQSSQYEGWSKEKLAKHFREEIHSKEFIDKLWSEKGKGRIMQTNIGNCYLLSALLSLFNTKEGCKSLMDCFSVSDDNQNLIITFNKTKEVISANKLFKNEGVDDGRYYLPDGKVKISFPIDSLYSTRTSVSHVFVQAFENAYAIWRSYLENQKYNEDQERNKGVLKIFNQKPHYQEFNRISYSAMNGGVEANVLCSITGKACCSEYGSFLDGISASKFMSDRLDKSKFVNFSASCPRYMADGKNMPEDGIYFNHAYRLNDVLSNREFSVTNPHDSRKDVYYSFDKFFGENEPITIELDYETNYFAKDNSIELKNFIKPSENGIGNTIKVFGNGERVKLDFKGVDTANIKSIYIQNCEIENYYEFINFVKDCKCVRYVFAPFLSINGDIIRNLRELKCIGTENTIDLHSLNIKVSDINDHFGNELKVYSKDSDGKYTCSSYKTRDYVGY